MTERKSGVRFAQGCAPGSSWQSRTAISLAFTLLAQCVFACAAESKGKVSLSGKAPLVAMGFVPVIHSPQHGRYHVVRGSGAKSAWRKRLSTPFKPPVKSVPKGSAAAGDGKSGLPTGAAGKAVVKAPTANATDNSAEALQTLSVKAVYDGVFYKVFSGRLPSGGHARINLLDIDMSRSPVKIRPVTGSYAFAKLKDVREHCRDSGALAAINANYFKTTNGIPLGTLIEDGDWLAGPLYDRVTLGFTEGGYARIDRVSLHGLLYTDNTENPVLWINNVNQPRRTGSHCILYTRHWGGSASLPYPGVLVGVDASGRVVSTDDMKLTIPYGGFVLADSKGSPISKLKEGEQVNIRWQIHPGDWANVTEAVSGGPLLLKNGKLDLDLKREKFPASFVGSHIHSRTACGITADDHLLLATFEGPHSMYDIAKFFLKRGCTEAMNLDGGGSTTMVVDGKTVTANANHAQRRVAVALGLFSPEKARALSTVLGGSYRPTQEMASFVGTSIVPYEKVYKEAIRQPEADPLMTSLMSFDLRQQSDEVRSAAVSQPQPLDDAAVLEQSLAQQEPQAAVSGSTFPISEPSPTRSAGTGQLSQVESKMPAGSAKLKSVKPRFGKAPVSLLKGLWNR
ncbi:MAG TPA: phosphodiester glycosidase family protein [Candidatus Obscuribacter sp.]|nr:phosphodiester glycosidase family protein [Candidatus Obscuribacter sp.]